MQVHLYYTLQVSSTRLYLSRGACSRVSACGKKYNNVVLCIYFDNGIVGFGCISFMSWLTEHQATSLKYVCISYGL